MYSRYAQVFDKHCENFTENPATNLKYLKKCQALCNEKLHTNGYLFLSDVYDIIGLPPFDNIEGIGWWVDLYDDENANFVDFGIYDRTKKTSRDFVNGLQPEIILDFNINGNLADYLLDLGFHLGGPDMAQEFYDKHDRYRQYLIEMGYEYLWDSLS